MGLQNFSNLEIFWNSSKFEGKCLYICLKISFAFIKNAYACHLTLFFSYTKHLTQSHWFSETWLILGFWFWSGDSNILVEFHLNRGLSYQYYFLSIFFLAAKYFDWSAGKIFKFWIVFTNVYFTQCSNPLCHSYNALYSNRLNRILGNVLMYFSYI